MRMAAFAAGTLAFALLAPIARAATSLAVLPDALEAYLRPVEGLTNFTFFPWAGFVFAGAILGVLLDRARPGDRERSLNVAFALGGAGLAAAAYGASFLPSPYARSEYWTTSPAFFFLRLGLLTAAIAAAYAWGRRRGGQHRWSPVEQLGRTSFFIYWIHVEMVYGLISVAWHHRLTLPQVCAALAGFLVFMLCCSIWRDRVAAWWNGRRPGVKASDPAAVR
jgi:fucose 4-O-acetylase-like acetyltransferase